MSRRTGAGNGALALAVALIACGGDESGPGTFGCGSGQCLQRSEYCETVIGPVPPGDVVSETCKPIPSACDALAARTCTPDDTNAEDLAMCIEAQVPGATGWSASCLLGGHREVFITIQQQ